MGSSVLCCVTPLWVGEKKGKQQERHNLFILLEGVPYFENAQSLLFGKDGG